ncbi:uncharacterized protein LOC128718230 [Anopheles marshallii]|uniref:uncharacterized protein LOC128718230 n=1 Tax=Anopheles marshallii TaxID=1521116 RepID=UPI00237C4221|nr:uncharacterized protein LOC128718230 [Anopheles marshallii]
MKTLLLKRILLDERVQQIKEAPQALIATEYDGVKVSVNLQRVDDLWERYEQLQEQIVEKCATEDERKSTTVSNSLPRIDLKLPRMNLPTFDGDILKWASFHDLFDSAIHRNVSLQESQKLYFLKTNLSDEAAALISHFKIEDGNYEPALEKLKQRYNKPLEAAANQIDRFLNQTPMNRPSADGLRLLHDVSDEMIRALDALQQDSRDIWLIHILVSKLDSETKHLWCQKRAECNENKLTLVRFLKFIDDQSSVLLMAKRDCTKSRFEKEAPRSKGVALEQQSTPTM